MLLPRHGRLCVAHEERHKKGALAGGRGDDLPGDRAVGPGCARYQFTLTSGNVITAKSKPKLDPATQMYRFKDATGQEVVVPSMRIRLIEPK